jgi:hypothetical protein
MCSLGHPDQRLNGPLCRRNWPLTSRDHQRCNGSAWVFLGNSKVVPNSIRSPHSPELGITWYPICFWWPLEVKGQFLWQRGPFKRCSKLNTLSSFTWAGHHMLSHLSLVTSRGQGSIGNSNRAMFFNGSVKFNRLSPLNLTDPTFDAAVLPSFGVDGDKSNWNSLKTMEWSF